MEEYLYLLNLAVILISTKFFGLVFKKFQMPQVVGALLAGFILGPAVFNILHETTFVKQVSELGVIVLMFSAGLETDIKEFKRNGRASFIIALIGVIVPLIGGFVTAYFFNKPTIGESEKVLFLRNLFIGVILTATSVSITVETLKEIGKLNTSAGNAILGAAIIDDVLGIIALTIITGVTDTSINILTTLLKVVAFFSFCIIMGFLFYELFKKIIDMYKVDLRRFVIIAFAFCLLMSFSAEVFFGVADITGAYIAGLIISNTSKKHYLQSRFSTLSYILLSPMFFASIGIKVYFPHMTNSLIAFSLILVIVAFLTKMVGCGIGAKMCGYTQAECWQIGAGMVSRGEVALIISNKGAEMGLMSQELFGPVVIVVIVTTILSPVILKVVFNKKFEKRLDYTLK